MGILSGRRQLDSANRSSVRKLTQYALPGSGARTVRVFFVGNSVTDTINYQGLAELARLRGRTQVWGRHMIPGAPLFYMWRETNGFVEAPFGTTQNALGKFAWDHVVVQPFDRHLVDANDEGDLFNSQKMLDLAVARNPNVRFWVYARWPRISRNGKGFPYDKNDYDPRKPGSGVPLAGVDDFHARWTARYSGDKTWDLTNESRDYFVRLADALNRANPRLRHPVRMVPVGDVMDAMDARMRAGDVPGYTSIYQLYRDTIHLTAAGSYLVGCVFLAALCEQPALDLQTTFYGDIDPRFVRAVQQITSAVVLRRPFA